MLGRHNIVMNQTMNEVAHFHCLRKYSRGELGHYCVIDLICNETFWNGMESSQHRKFLTNINYFISDSNLRRW